MYLIISAFHQNKFDFKFGILGVREEWLLSWTLLHGNTWIVLDKAENSFPVQ